MPRENTHSTLEAAIVAAKLAVSICDAPVLGVVKPVAEVAVTICESAKMVKTNKTAAVELAQRAAEVTKTIVERAALQALVLTQEDSDIVMLGHALHEVLEYVRGLEKGRWKTVRRWVLAQQDQDEITRLKANLNEALQLFIASRVLQINRDVQMLTVGVAATGRDVQALITTQAAASCDVQKLASRVMQTNDDARMLAIAAEGMAHDAQTEQLLHNEGFVLTIKIHLSYGVLFF